MTRGYFDEANIIAAHIVPVINRLEIAGCIFGTGSGSQIDSVDNYLVIHTTVERSMDNGDFVLLPAVPQESLLIVWKLHLRNSFARWQSILLLVARMQRLGLRGMIVRKTWRRLTSLFLGS